MTDAPREPIDAQLLPAYDEHRISGTWNRIAGARQRRPHRASRAWILAAVGAAAVAITVIAWPKHHDRALVARDSAISAAPGAIWTHISNDVVLDDNSRISLDANAQLQVLANDGNRFSTLLQSGIARFDVTPGGPRRWEIETALASVEVVGTSFIVDAEADRLTVQVSRGTVVVHGERVPGRVVRLVAGQHIVVERTVTAAAQPVVQPAPSQLETPHATVRNEPAPRPTPPPRVAQAAPTPAATEPSIAEVIAAADRLSADDPAGAATVLEKAHAHDGLVSFTLGRLYLDRLGKPELAATAFADVIARGKPHALIEDAHARRVEALLRAGLVDGAKTALAEYAHAFPAGRRLAALREAIDKAAKSADSHEPSPRQATP